MIDQAGAIAFRRHGRGFDVLLVTAKRDRMAWIFPKGHIEDGETPEAAALRETREEAGVVGTAIGLAGAPLEFTSKSEEVRVQYFLVEATGETTPEDDRGVRWVPRAEAAAALTHPNARALLESVLPDIERHLATER
jgi:8-oxo-dGTP pyrophosphatase MutT (NUDIX family)